MKYMIVLYGSQQDYGVLSGRRTDKPAMSPEEVAAMRGHMESLHKELAESGELVDAQGLTATAHARRILLRNGSPVGPEGRLPVRTERPSGGLPLRQLRCGPRDGAMVAVPWPDS